MKKIIGIFIFVSLVSCVTTKYDLKTDLKIETLSICVNYNDLVPNNIRYRFDEIVYNFVNEYNKTQHEFNLSLCDDTKKSALNIYIRKTILVTTGRQIYSTIISVCGLSLPFIMIAAECPFIVLFYTFPNDVTYVNLKLTPDLSPFNKVYYRHFENSGYLRNKKKQIFKHGIEFNRFLNTELEKIEKQYRHNREVEMLHNISTKSK